MAFLMLCLLSLEGAAAVIVPEGSSWKYLDNGSNQGTAWRASAFDDSAWASGNAELGYGDGDEVTEVGFGGNINNRYATTYFRKSFSVTAPESWDTLLLEIKRDDGAIVYLNNAEVMRSNMPAGTVIYTTLTTNAADDGATWISSAIPVSSLLEGTNVFAVEIHQTSLSSTDISFNLRLNGILKPASCAAITPATNAVAVPLSPTLTARATSASGAPLSVSFYGRQQGVGNFTLLQTNTNVPSGGTTSTTWPGLAPLTIYEWYVAASDGTNSAQSNTLQFTTRNHPPTADSQTVNTDEDTAVAVVLTGGDADGDPLTFTVSSAPSHGSLSGTPPNLTYTPNLNYFGPDSFIFQTNDGYGNSAPGTVSISVAPVNDAPVTYPQTVGTEEEVPITVTAASDPDGDELFLTILDSPDHGVLTMANGAITYTPDVDYIGSDSFTFKASDGTLEVASTTISVSVVPLNQAPVAANQSVITDEDTALAIVLSASDLENSPLTYSVVAAPTHGSLSGSGANLSYAPAANYYGADSFTFKASDGVKESNVAIVSITINPVNDAPLGTAQNVTLDKNTAIKITLAASDAEGDTLSYAIATQPNHGTLSGSAPNLIYVPQTDYLGADSFSFTANDGSATSAATTVTLDIQSINISPAITRGPYLQSPSQNAITLRWRTATAVTGIVRYGPTATTLNSIISEQASGVEHTVTLSGLTTDTRYYYSIGTSLDTTANGDDYSFRTHPISGQAKPTSVWVLGDFGTNNSNQPNQIAVRNAFQSYSATHPIDFWLMLGDNAYETGTDTEYQTGVFNIYPTIFRNTPVWPTLGNHDQGSLQNPFAAAYYSIFNLPNAGQSGGVPSGTEAYYSFDYANIHFVCLDSQGSNRASNGAMAAWLQQDLAASSQEWLVAFFHHPPYSGATSHNSDTETPMVEMRQIFVPILESYGVDLVLSGHCHVYERSKLINGHTGVRTSFNSATMQKNGGDGDPAGNGAYVKNDSGQQGAVFAVAGNGGRTIDNIVTPHPVMMRSIMEYGSVIIDVNASQLTAKMLNKDAQIRDTFSIIHNSQPIATGQSLNAVEDTALPISLAGTDTESDPLSYSVVTQPAHGTLTGSGQNLTYTPALNYNGTDSFTFKVNDGFRDSTPATVSFTIQPVDDLPTATPLSVTANEDASLPITLVGSDPESPFGMLGNYVQQQFINSLPVIVDGLSGATWNANTHTLFLIRNVSGAAAESFEFSANGTHLRTISQTDFVDTEAIAWMYGNTFAIAEENNNQRITICTIAPGATTLNRTASGNVTYNTPVGNLLNLGIESLCYDPDADRLYYCTEKPANSHWYIYSMNPNDGTTTILCDLMASIGTSGLATDLTDMAVDRGNRTLLIASHESQNIIRVNFSGTVIETLPITAFTQAEAIALTPDRQTLFVGGEAKQFARYTLPTANLTYRIVTQPTHGSLSGVPPAVFYTPTLNYFGPDSFSYVVNDGFNDSAPVSVTITVNAVNDAPSAAALSQTTDEDTPLSIMLQGTDPELDSLTFTVVTQPLHGTLSGVPPNITYTPALNFHGTDSFTFKANDGALDSGTQAASLTITSVPDPAEISLEQPAATTLVSGTSNLTFGPTSLGSPSYKIVTLRNLSPDNALTGISATITGANASDFNITAAPPASLAASNSTTFTIRFTPQATGSRSASLSITSNDSLHSPFSLNLTGTGNTAPTFAGYSLNLKSGQSTSVSLSKILAKASDPDGDALSVLTLGSSTVGATASLGFTNLSYTAPATAAVDTIPITITDARGGKVTGNLTVNIVADNALANNTGKIVVVGNTVAVEFYGIPGRNYQVQHSCDLSTWTTKATVTADNLGRIIWTDPTPGTSCNFYRTRQAQ